LFGVQKWLKWRTLFAPGHIAQIGTPQQDAP
jgi:hypothetical protein